MKNRFARTVWQLIICLIFAQVMMLKADQPIAYSLSGLDDKKTHPIKLAIDIYRADRLPIGENYMTKKQVVDSHATHIADLDFSFHLKSGFTFEEGKAKGTLSCKLIERVNLLVLEMDLSLLELEDLEIKSRLVFKFRQELLLEYSSSSDDELVYVVIIKPEKLNWIKEEQARKNELPRRIQEMQEELQSDYIPRPVELSPEIIKVSKEDRANYIKKMETIRKVEYTLNEIHWRYFLPEAFPIVKQMNANAGKVYDVSKWFGCDENHKKQWVHYHTKTKKLTGNVDGFVDVRLRELVLVNNQSDAELLKVSAELVMVDVKAAETMENIKLLEKQGKLTRLQSWAHVSNSEVHCPELQSMTITNGEAKVNIKCFGCYWGFSGLEMIFDDEGNREGERFKHTGFCPTGRNLVMRCGLSFGENQEEKCLLILRINKLDAYDRYRRAIPQADPNLQYTKLEPIAEPKNDRDLFADEKRGFDRYKAEKDFINMISSSMPEGPLYHFVTTPDHSSFDSSDVVIDLKKLFSWEGIRLEDEDAVFYNVDKAEIICRMSASAERDFEDMLQSLRARTISNYYQTTVHFHEVDNREDREKAWDASMVLLSNPKNLGSAGLPGYGEIEAKGVKLSLKKSENEVAGDIHDVMKINLDYMGDLVSKVVPVKRVIGIPKVTELKRGAKRSLVAMVVVEEIR